MDLAQLEEFLVELGEKPYTAKQLREWLFKGVRFDEMTNLKKTLREKLNTYAFEGYAQVSERNVSADGTIKYLLSLPEGGLVECVSMQYHHGRTLCVSTQLGCRMGCVFCASGKDGLERNLSTYEMLSEWIAARLDGEIGNVVLMGSGEPLDNYNNVMGFIRLLTKSLGIGMRHISLSTCGLVPGIKKLANEGLAVTLCISLHAATDEKRRRIMPVANAYTVNQIISAAKGYFKKTGRRIIIEYTLIKGFNDSQDDVLALKNALAGLHCHVNVIPLNTPMICADHFTPPNTAQTHAFAASLCKAGKSATVRRALGSDIEGACGQLKLQREVK